MPFEIEKADPIAVESVAIVEANGSPYAIIVFAEEIVVLENNNSPSEN